MEDFFLSADEDHYLWKLIAETRHVMLKVRERELSKHNISSMQSAVLFAIRALGDKATPSEITRQLFREHHSISELLKRMEKAGLLRKVKGKYESKQTRIELTEKGCEAYCKSSGRESVHKIMSSLSEERRKQLRSCLEIVFRTALKELAKESTNPFRVF